MHRARTIIIAAAVCALVALGVVILSGGWRFAPSSNWEPGLLVNGRRITPAGTTSGSVGNMPLNVVISPDGKYAVTSACGVDPRLCSVRVSDGKVVDTLSFPSSFSQGTKVQNGGLFYGLAFDPTPADGAYTFYAAQGAYGCVATVTLGSDGKLAKKGTIPQAPIPYMPVDQPAGIAYANGVIFMANYVGVDLKSAYQPASTLSLYRAGDGTRLGSYTFMDAAGTNTPNFPYAVVARSDGARAYVASQRDGAVYVLDTSDPAHISLVSEVTGLSQPSALLLNKAQTVLFVANAESDTISVVDVSGDDATVTATVLLRPSNVTNLAGVTPSGLSLSPDEKTLYASLGDFNAIGVVDTQTAQLRGYIPAGWYPTALSTTPDGRALLVVNGWGTKAKNPNPGFNYLEPDMLGIDRSGVLPAWANRPGDGYVLSAIPGNVSRIDLTRALPGLSASSAQVIRNNQNTVAMGNYANNTLSTLGVKSGKIQHVIYVIKENRGYDQVLGDLPKGNGDPSLTLYGRTVTPNQHALAERFILLDNFYNNAPVTGEGWQWCTQSIATAFTVKFTPYVYQLSLTAYQLNASTSGQVNGYITGGYPQKDQDGNFLSSTGTGAPSVPSVAAAPGGYIWDGVNKAGLTYRNYGFFLSSGAPSKPPYAVPDNYPTVTGLSPAGHIPTPEGQVPGVTDYDFRMFDFSYPDSDAWLKWGFDAKSVGIKTGDPVGYYKSPNSPVTAQPSRISEWEREFDEMLAQDPTGATVPNFMTIRLGRDHTMGLNPGYAAPAAMMADNDYAVGELVEAVSNSPIWESTVIFIVEDDAQFSNDHVDSHRSICQVISPWIKKSTVDHRFYDTNSALKSMELLLGLSPMSQYDKFALPIVGGWDSAPRNNAAYSAILPAKDIIGGVNPPVASYSASDPLRQLAAVSSQLDWREADAAPYNLLNQVLWTDAKGAAVTMPALRTSTMTLPSELQIQESDDDD